MELMQFDQRADDPILNDVFGFGETPHVVPNALDEPAAIPAYQLVERSAIAGSRGLHQFSLLCMF
jgi:hypothetical protein